jgi:hypothetical protein
MTAADSRDSRRLLSVKASSMLPRRNGTGKDQ